MSFTLKLSEATSDLIEQISSPSKDTYIKERLAEQEQNWVETYNLIKADNWPSIKGYADFKELPDYIKTECTEVHKFSDELFKQAIIDDATMFNNRVNEIKYHPIILSVMDRFVNLINGKSVIDIGCNFGHWSIFANSHGASHVIGSDVRQENVNIAKLCQQDLGIDPSALQFVKSDVHDYAQLKNLCSDRTTVFFLGLLYHVHDHYNVLESLCQPSVEHIFIETAEVDEYCETSDPLIWWKQEPSYELIAGYHNHKDKILVGYPNEAWITMAMEVLGFNLSFKEVYNIYNSNQKLEKEKYRQRRIIMLFERIAK